MVRTGGVALRPAVIAGALLLASCFGPSELAVGPCTLTVAVNEGGRFRDLTPPFTVELPEANDPIFGGVDLLFSGTGWNVVEVTMQHDSGAEFEGCQLMGQELREGPAHGPNLRVAWRVAGPAVGLGVGLHAGVLSGAPAVRPALVADTQTQPRALLP